MAMIAHRLGAIFAGICRDHARPYSNIYRPTGCQKTGKKDETGDDMAQYISRRHERDIWYSTDMSVYKDNHGHF